MPKLGLGLGLPKTRVAGGFTPKKLSGLSLWLKADAGVDKIPQSYNYVSQIVISGTSSPSFNGTYTATTPSYNSQSSKPNNYNFTSPEGRIMSWDLPTESYQLYLDDGFFTGGFTSSDGINWTTLNPYINSITITGATGSYTGINGTYNFDGDLEHRRYTHTSGNFRIDEEGYLVEQTTGYNIIIATNVNSSYTGSWTPTTYVNSVTISGCGNSDFNATYSRPDDYIEFGGNFAGDDAFIYNDGAYNDPVWRIQGFGIDNAYFSNDLTTWYAGEAEPPDGSGTTTSASRVLGSPTSTSTFSPTGSISGSITTSTATAQLVSAWADQSGNGRDFSKSVSNTGYPTYINNDILFSASNTYGDSNASILALPSSSLNLTGPYTLIGVFRAGAGNSCLFSKSTEESKRRKYQMTLNGGIIYALESGNNEDTSISYDTGTDDVNVKRLVVTQFLTNTSGLIRYNGQEVATGDGGGSYGYALDETNSPSVFIGASPFDEGNGYNAEASTDMHVNEIIFYDRALSTEEIQQVESYLNRKYSIY